MDTNLMLATFLASGAGWFAGFYFERRKARAAFRSWAKNLSEKVIMSSTIMVNTAMDMLAEKCPTIDKGDMLKELISKCNAEGLQMVAMTGDQMKQLVKDGKAPNVIDEN